MYREGGGLTYCVAPYESDPQAVYLANRTPNSAILSSDGDLFFYPGALNNIVWRLLDQVSWSILS